jgi:hypothetical protein
LVQEPVQEPELVLAPELALVPQQEQESKLELQQVPAQELVQGLLRE